MTNLCVILLSVSCVIIGLSNMKQNDKIEKLQEQVKVLEATR